MIPMLKEFAHQMLINEPGLAIIKTHTEEGKNGNMKNLENITTFDK
jgi:hypothetical protein